MSKVSPDSGDGNDEDSAHSNSLKTNLIVEVLNPVDGTLTAPGWGKSLKDSLYEIYLSFRLGSKPQTPVYRYIHYCSSKKEQPQSTGRSVSLEDLNKIDYKQHSIRICCISDTHERHDMLTIPPCDVLIHTGDILFCGRKQSTYNQIRKLQKFNAWMQVSTFRGGIGIEEGFRHSILVVLRVLVPCFMWSGALDSSELLLPYFITSLA